MNPENNSILQRFAGPATLALLFCASGALTIAYLSDVSSPKTQSQTAAAAAPKDDPFSSVSLEAQSAYVLDLSTGKVLYSLNPEAQLPLASITKVMTILVVSQSLPPDTTVTIPYDTAPSGSAERLAKGQVWKLQDVINFTLIASSNDGAEILAAAANDAVRAKYPQAGEHATLWRMNNLAQELGMTHTYFLNASGLDLSQTQSGAYSSVHDIATMLSYAASTSPQTFEGTTQGGMLLTSINGNRTKAFNTNQALGAIPGLIMGKTGYTDLAGGNLGIVFDVGINHPVVAVVMHSSEEGRFDDMKKLVAATEQAVAQGE